MKRPNITPGPWSWQKRGKHGAVCMLNAYQPPGLAQNVLEVYGHIAESNCNARAISAVPDLLEALEDVATLGPEEVEPDVLLAYAQRARAALTKAGYTF